MFAKEAHRCCRQRSRGGLVSKAHRLCVSLNSRLESKEKHRWRCRGRLPRLLSTRAPPPAFPANAQSRFRIRRRHPHIHTCSAPSTSCTASFSLNAHFRGREIERDRERERERERETRDREKERERERERQREGRKKERSTATAAVNACSAPSFSCERPVKIQSSTKTGIAPRRQPRGKF